MAMMSNRIAPGELALQTISPAVMDSVSRTLTGELEIIKFPSKFQIYWESPAEPISIRHGGHGAYGQRCFQ